MSIRRVLTLGRLRHRVVQRLYRRQDRIMHGFIRLRRLIAEVLALHAAGKTRACHRAAKRMLDLEYQLLGDCDATAKIADAVDAPHDC